MKVKAQTRSDSIFINNKSLCGKREAVAFGFRSGLEYPWRDFLLKGAIMEPKPCEGETSVYREEQQIHELITEEKE